MNDLVADQRARYRRQASGDRDANALPAHPSGSFRALAIALFGQLFGQSNQLGAIRI